MPLDKEWFFRQLDSYVRTHYRCFVAELFPSENQAEYIVCFRPLGGVRGLPSEQYPFRYLNIAVADVSAAHREERLTETITEKLGELEASE
jgi:hypothetical protein